jgi:hypothetical protein
MATSTLRIRLEAWGNRRFLNAAIGNGDSEKMAAGVLMFMAFRQMLTRRLGRDYLEALAGMSRDERSLMLRSLKGVYLQMFMHESTLRRAHGNAYYDSIFHGTYPDPFAHRLAASMAIQLVSAQMAPASRAPAMACLNALLAVAQPAMPAAYQAARAMLDKRKEAITAAAEGEEDTGTEQQPSKALDAATAPNRGNSADDILGHVEFLTLEDLEQPLGKALFD